MRDPFCAVGASGCTGTVDLVVCEHVVPSNPTWDEFDVMRCVSCIVQEFVWDFDPSDAH